MTPHFTTVTRPYKSGPVTVPAETTSCEYLVIAPDLDDEGHLAHGGWCLVHAPTGRSLPSPFMQSDPPALRRLAEKVAHLDWTGTDRRALAARIKDDYIAAVREIEQDGTVSPFEQPNTSPGGKGIARQAGPMLADLLDSWQDLSEKHRDTPLRNDDDSPNPEWTRQLFRQVDLYGLAFVLAALRAHLPEVADYTAASLADAWESGDCMGEWTWQWRRELKAGEPLTLPGVPMPEPAELLAEPTR